MPGIAGVSGQAVLLVAALWAAIWLYRGERPVRFLLGLVAGCVTARLGWALFQLTVVAQYPTSILGLSAGYTVLFFPLGPLLFAPEDATWRALPMPLAVARLGCLVAGCGGGTDAPWGSQPTALYEAAWLLILHFSLSRSVARAAAPLFLMGFGLGRVVITPLRAAAAEGDPVLSPLLVSVGWMGFAGLMMIRHRITGPWCGASSGDDRLGIARPGRT